MSKVSANILVVSDLHLGEDLNPASQAEDTARVDLASNQFVNFVRHYTYTRQDSLPWRLVLNGDSVDFLSVFAPVSAPLSGDHDFIGMDTAFVTTSEVGAEQAKNSTLEKASSLRPAAKATQKATSFHREGKRGGDPSRNPSSAVTSLRAVLQRHPDVVCALSQFVRAGNYLELICGNHDAEFFFTEVQEVFVHTLCFHKDAATSNEQQQKDMASRIQFHDWFYYEPGVAWIEHGHQYDNCCSFAFNLCPVDSQAGTMMVNVDAAGMKHVANHVPGAGPDVTENWNGSGYVRFAKSLGIQGALHLGRQYLRFATALLTSWWNYAAQCQSASRDKHMQSMQRLATDSGLEDLYGISQLQQKPVVASLSGLMRVLMLDKVLLIVYAVFSTLGLLAAVSLGWATAFSLANLWLVIKTIRRTDASRCIDPSDALVSSSKQLLSHLPVPIVVFGHTHNPIAQGSEGGRWYFNSGTWVPSGKPGLLRSFSHVIIRQGAHGPTGNLRQWRDGRSKPFAASWRPKVKEDAILHGVGHKEIATGRSSVHSVSQEGMAAKLQQTA